MVLRVGTYNVLGLTGFRPPRGGGAGIFGPPGSESCSAHFAGAFAELDCDVLALQEGVPHIYMQSIADRLGCYLATFPSPTAPISDEQHPYPWGFPGHLLSRFPIVESRTFGHRVPDRRTRPEVVDELAREAGGEAPSNYQIELASSGAAGPAAGGALFSRHCGAALLDLGPTRGLLWVVGLHMLPGPASSAVAVETREQEAELLLRNLAELEAQAPTIVMGDFNSEVEEAVRARPHAPVTPSLRSTLRT